MRPQIVITANVITDEGVWMGSESQQIVGVEEYFLKYDVPTEESPLYQLLNKY